jgi:hypothetical protein
MKNTITAPFVIAGHDGINAFNARVYPSQRIMVVHSIDKDRALPNMGTEDRIWLIIREALFKHGVILWPWSWLVVEVQLCFAVTTVCKITGLRPRDHESTRYEQLTEEETRLIEPILDEIQD